MASIDIPDPVFRISTIVADQKDGTTSFHVTLAVGENPILQPSYSDHYGQEYGRFALHAESIADAERQTLEDFAARLRSKLL